jgi:hypothetical protein
MRIRRVIELDHQRMAIEDALNDPALCPGASAVNQPDFREPRLMGGRDVLLDNRSHIPRPKGMQIQARFDREVLRRAHSVFA